MDSTKGVVKLNILENDKFQEGVLKYPDYLELSDNIVHSLSREFVDTVRNENIPFLAFYSQVCADLQLAVLSTLRQHDIQACQMLRHALESVALAAYATIFKPGADEAQIVTVFGDTDKAYKWIEVEFPEDSAKLKALKKKINENYAHANILTAAARISEGDEKLNCHFFDTNSSMLIGPRLYVISEIAWLSLDLLDRAVSKANNGILLQTALATRLKEYSEQIDKVFADLKNERR